jgi:hypothetical protein
MLSTNFRWERFEMEHMVRGHTREPTSDSPAISWIRRPDFLLYAFTFIFTLATSLCSLFYWFVWHFNLSIDLGFRIFSFLAQIVRACVFPLAHDVRTRCLSVSRFQLFENADSTTPAVIWSARHDSISRESARVTPLMRCG